MSAPAAERTTALATSPAWRWRQLGAAEVRTTLVLPADLAKAVDDYWHARRLSSRPDAIRELLAYALDAKLAEAREGAAAWLMMPRMSDDDRERSLRIAWLEKQMQKADFDMGMELRKLRRQTWTITLSGISIVVAAFAAGAAWWNYLHH